MNIHKMEQRSPEWFAVKLGKMSASEAACIVANGSGLETYATRLVVEKLTGVAQSAFKGNHHTDRGNEQENDARVSYEIANDVIVEQVGFIELDEYTGCSPDGLIAEEGGFEAKCPNDIKYFKMLIGILKPDTANIWQCKMTMHLTGRKWWDLVYYNSNFTSNMITHRIELDMESQEKLIMGIAKGKKLIQELNKKYEQVNS